MGDRRLCSALACRFMYASVDTKYPLYSMPHFSFATTCFPVSCARKGRGLTGTLPMALAPTT